MTTIRREVERSTARSRARRGQTTRPRRVPLAILIAVAVALVATVIFAGAARAQGIGYVTPPPCPHRHVALPFRPTSCLRIKPGSFARVQTASYRIAITSGDGRVRLHRSRSVFAAAGVRWAALLIWRDRVVINEGRRTIAVYTREAQAVIR